MNETIGVCVEFQIRDLLIESDCVRRYRPSYNVSPGFNLPVVRREDASDSEGYAVHWMKWGLIPSFTKKSEKPDHYKMVKSKI